MGQQLQTPDPGSVQHRVADHGGKGVGGGHYIRKMHSCRVDQMLNRKQDFKGFGMVDLLAVEN